MARKWGIQLSPGAGHSACQESKFGTKATCGLWDLPVWPADQPAPSSGFTAIDDNGSTPNLAHPIVPKVDYWRKDLDTHFCLLWIDGVMEM